MSWLSTLTSAEGAAALLKSAVSKVESQIDKVLDIPQSPKTGRSSETVHASSPPSSSALTEQPPPPPQQVRHQPNWDKLSQKSATVSPRPGQRKGKSPRASSDTSESVRKSPTRTAEPAPPPARLNADAKDSDPPTQRDGGSVKLAEAVDSADSVASQSTQEPTQAREEKSPRASASRDNPSALRKPEGTKRLSYIGPPVTVSDIQATSRADDLIQLDSDVPAESVEVEGVAVAVAGTPPQPREESAALSSEATGSPTTVTLPATTMFGVLGPAELNGITPSAPAEIDAAPSAPVSASLTEQPQSISTDTPTQLGRESSPPDTSSANPLQVVLDRREEQLMTAMHENAMLTDTLTTLKRQLEMSEDQRSLEREESESAINRLRVAAAESEKRFAAMREASSSQSSLQASFEEAMRKLGQKEELVAQLMLEGERLSKAELKFNMTIKRLRAEKVETEKERKADAAKIEKLEAEVTLLKGKVAEAVDSEKKHSDAARTLNEASERHAKEVKRLQGELDAALQAQSSLQSALDATKVDLAESRQGASDASAAAESEALEEERRTVTALRAELAALRKEAEHVQGALTDELQDLRRTIAQKEEEAGWKEDALRREVASLQHRLQDVEAQNHELAVAGNESAQPLLRQIEMLQSQHAAAVRKWEVIERQLTAQLQGAEVHRTRAANLERDHAVALASLTEQLEGLRGELATSHAAARGLHETIAARDATAAELQTNLDAALGRMAQLEEEHRMVQSLSNRNEERLRRELDEERRKQEEKSKSVPRLTEADPPAKDSSPVPPASPAPPPALQIETARKPPKPTMEPRRASSYANSPSTADLRLSDSAASNFNTAAAIERLTATVRHYEGQLSSLRTQLEMAEQGRNDLAEELVVLHEEQEKSKKLAEQVEGFRAERDELNTRYVAALELLGEKTERVQELQADIADMKGIFKQQLSDMMRELDALRGGGGSAA
ncbi:hypothetical protein HDU86_007841 [Geranomyces michiganensis]|nr:hypothetical protein HDU86_007841 [Geranomyces michiganensis]